MPDIRNFFGGGGGAVKSPASAPSQDKPAPKKSSGRGRPRKVVSDDEDEVEEVKPKKSTPAKRKPAKEEPKEEEETSSSAYFASNKPSKAAAATNGTASTPKKTAANGSAPNSARRSARKSTKTSYLDDDDDDVEMKLDDTRDGGDDDIHADDFKVGREADDYESDSDGDDLPIRPQKQNGRKKTAIKNEDDEDDLEVAETKLSPVKKSAAKKRKADDSEEDETPKKKSRKSTGTATTRKPKAKKDEEPDTSAAKQILDSIELTVAPDAPPRDESRKFTYTGGASGNAHAAPTNAGSKDIPQGEPACLTGLTFVFTGVLESLGRDEGVNLVKKYGGKTTTAPSSRTDFVVLGEEAGPKKLETIKKLGIKTINEDGLFDLIRKMPAGGGDSKAAAAAQEKEAKATKKQEQDAREEEKRAKEKQRQVEKEAKAAAAARGVDYASKPKLPSADDRLWVDKYAPDSMSTICGNKGLVEKLQKWLREWPRNAQKNFKQGGADGYGVHRAAMLHGPPGIGKTTSAHLVAKLEGYDIVESNASDTRSKKLVEGGLKGVLDTTSLLGYFAGDGKKVDATKKKLVLIMDEVDGMSAGDRGGVGALAAIAKKTNIPMILICNDRKLPKMKPFDFVTADFAFKRPTVDMIRARIMTICFREGFKLPKEVIDAIIEGARGDIRQIINMISTIKLDAKDRDMQFNDGKAMSKAWEKHAILKPWDIVSKILRAEMFSQASKATLNEKIELYFNDHEFSYLMLQENYLKTKMSAIPSDVPARKQGLKALELVEKAAESISDGDLVDRMIHGSQQHWSLMPTHAVFSFVRPASYTYGNIGSQVGFTSWLGNNSKQGKLSRFVKEIQAHTRLRTSADRHEIRQQYMPALWNNTVGLLNKKGLDAVPEVIEFMDQYYLTKDDYDALIELGLGPMDESKVNLETKTKAAFTRQYNAASHPITHIKPGATSAKLGGGVKRDKPDLEEAVEDEDAEEVVDEANDSGSEIDLKKDKYIKAPKKKKAPAKSAGKGKGKAKKSKDEASDLDDDDEEEDSKPKKRGTSAGRGRGRGRGKG